MPSRKTEMKGRKVHIVILGLCSLLCLATGCRPRGILHSWEMRSLLVDLHKTDAILQVAGVSHNSTEVKAIYYAQVLEKHGVTQAEFDSSLVWYTDHPQLFDKIYPRVLKDLKAEETAFLALHESDIYPMPQARDFQQPVVSFSQAQLDSVLWVTQHGYVHTWNPLVHDFKDEFFPQICVLR